MSEKVCRKCGVVLTDDNCSPSVRKRGERICKGCSVDKVGLWRKNNPENTRAIYTRRNRKNGALPMNENKDCSSYLGVHIAERVLRHVFNDVEVMPNGNPGYDIKCNKGKLIDIKSACARKSGGWAFHINRNTIADYFICLAFGNREDLNPLHIWLLPGSEFNHLVGTGISPSTIHKWDEYKLDIDKVIACCDIMKNGVD